MNTKNIVKLQGGVSVFTNRTNGQGVVIDSDYIGMWDDTGTQVARFPKQNTAGG